MTRQSKSDPTFEISFFESVHRRCPRYTDVIGLLGGLYTKTGRIADGLKMDRKMVRLQPESDLAHYNLACSLALSNRAGDALTTLRKALELGYDDHRWMQQDPDLEILRDLPEFKKILEQVRRGHAQS
ncbi:MAG: hypothetical protein Q8J74_09995 [Candidatus Didemnitutus sp.]|nr:hypothetical protein [Candidatus Didemnitutus sp.]